MAHQLPELMYEADVFPDNQLGKDGKAPRVQAILGIEFGGKTVESWFSQHAVMF